MMTSRDRWKVCKRVCLMFFLAVVTLTVVKRGNISTGPQFQLESQARMEPHENVETHNKNPYTLTNLFWRPNQAQPKPNQEEPRNLTQEHTFESWDITSANCSANLNITRTKWFAELEPHFKQFILYRHCRYFPMTINHPEKCSGDIHLLMVVKSIITQHDRREVIRKTWGKEQMIDGKQVKTIFLLGASSNEAEKANHQKLLEYEDYIYGDILQWDFLDSFFNLTLKEAHFLKWFSTYCPGVHYIFKGDDDVFVSVQNVIQYLEISSDVESLFAGDVIFNAKPIRQKANKYYIPHALYKKSWYPPYATGGGFLMDGPLARKLYPVSETLELYPIDDVFLGMCLEVLKVTPIRHNAFKTFGLMRNKESKLNREPCLFKSLLVVHRLLPLDLMRMWKLVNSNIVCSQNVHLLSGC